MVKINNVINNKNILLNIKPYVIAEAINHEGSMVLAKRLIDEAIEGVLKQLNFKFIRQTPLHQKIVLIIGIYPKNPQEVNMNCLRNMINFGKRSLSN